jgi:hypothetical protein
MLAAIAKARWEVVCVVCAMECGKEWAGIVEWVEGCVEEWLVG